ncbi:MAG TPA: rod shape-determining protein [Candidatus Dorea intestinavium]|nr:rod shape-determining protein [Candidatus Dorea intestinavium]
MARNVYGLDLGSTVVKIYDKKTDKIIQDRTVLAIEDGKEYIATGKEAFLMYGRVPSNIEVIFPMHAGVVSRFDAMQHMLSSIVNRESGFTRGSEYVVAVPTDVTEVEKKAFFDLVVHSNAKAKEVNIVERSIADAVGLNIDIEKTKGVMIINMGGETTEVSVLAGGGMVLNRLVKVGGHDFDTNIVSLLRRSQDFLIGIATAETLRRNFNVFNDDSSTMQSAAGVDLITGTPMQKNVPITVVRGAIKEPLDTILEAIISVLDRTPPEVRKAIYQNGLFITGGLANMVGLERYIEHGVNIRTRLAPKPELTVVKGLKKIIMSQDLKSLAYSMMDEGYRWMR